MSPLPNESRHMNRAMSLALALLGSLYGVAMKARRALYRNGLFRVYRLDVPVISVGNLTTGGTGKTPLVEWLANELAQKGRQACILTRGYGRKSSGTRVIVSNAVEVLSDAVQAGDEPFLLAERLRGRAAVISDVDRVSAARWSVENLKSDVFVLDDSFQHQRLARNLNIATIDATNPWGNRKLLPAGILREPPTELARADCVVITRADDSTQTEQLQSEIDKLRPGCPVFRSRMSIRGLRPVQDGLKSNGRLLTAEEVKSSSVAAFCGIGNPESFFAQLRRGGYHLCHAQAFRDHHVYNQNDINRIVSQSVAFGAQVLLTTAKDEVKLRSLSFELPCYAVDIAIEIEHEERLSALVQKAISDSKLDKPKNRFGVNDFK
jgi:tetraacyldisaccharide 4'-kinase